MAHFQADFTHYPTDPKLLAAPAQVDFTNTSTIANAIDDGFTYAVDLNGNTITPVNPLSSYVISTIEKYGWDFGDKSFSSDFNVIKKYDFAGVYNVSLSIYSQEIVDDNGVHFRIKSVKTITLEITSMMFAWLKMHMTQPHLEALDNSPAFTDLIQGSSKLFDRMFADITQVANLMDIKNVAPKFLEFFSDTFNHQRFYAKKVGYAKQSPTDTTYEGFLTYDIFDRIAKGIASDPEIELFRQFIIDTAALFREKGSEQSIKDFFKLYDFIMHIKDMWTTNFGTTSPKPLSDDFLIDPTLEHTKNKFKFKGFSVTGWDNSLAHMGSAFNSVILDNYHFVSQHAYPSGVLFGDSCSQTFEINDYNPKVIGIFRDDGREITDKLSCFGFDIGSTCTTGTSGTPGSISIVKNTTWTGASKVVEEYITYKLWQAPQGYVNNVITKFGILPVGPDEIAEVGPDYPDDYMWADWQYGITVPNGIPGVSTSSLHKPTVTTQLPNVDWSTTSTNDNLIQSPGFSPKTEHDFFLATRGFIHINRAGYYVFSLNTGNTGVGGAAEQIALFSLKHTKTYSRPELDTLQSLDDITFIRDNTDVVHTIGTTATGTYNLYSKAGEYGIIEIRQNEIDQNSGYYYITPGYYAFEVKASYGSAADKKLQLLYEGHEVIITGDEIQFNNFLTKRVIPKENLFTLTARNLSIADAQGKGYMIVPNTLIEGGDIFDVVYTQSNGTNEAVSGILTLDKSFQDMEMLIRFTTVGQSILEESNTTSPQQTIMAVFRGIHSDRDLYADVDAYYALIFDGKDGKVSLANITYNTELGGAIVHRLNLNPKLNEKDAQQFSIQLIDENGYNFTVEDGIYYDIVVHIKDNKVSASYRKNVKFTDAISHIANTVSHDVTKFVDDDPFTTIFTDIDLLQTDADVQTTDWNGNVLSVADKYIPIEVAGHYGFAIQSSNIKIERVDVVPFDDVDENLVETVEKWKTIKPKFLDSRPNKLLSFNSYPLQDSDLALAPVFTVNVTGIYDGTTPTLPLPQNLNQVTDNSVQSVQVGNICASSWGTRFNIVFDGDWLKARFHSVQTVLDAVSVPFGNFQEPFINWSQIDTNVSGDTALPQAGYYPIINDTFRVMPHTIAVSANSKGYLSDMVRNTTDPLLVQLNNGSPLATLLNATNTSSYNGAWEEVCPLSTSTTWIPGRVDNQVFEMIYRDKANKQQIIGVKLINQDTANQLICRYCDGQIVWGLYEITLPAHTSQNQIQYNNQQVPQEILFPIRYFVPIGKLSPDNLYLLPPPELLRNGIGTVELKGVFAHIGSDSFTLVDKTTLKLNSLNAYEEKYKSKVKCQYFLDVETSFVGKLTDYNKFAISMVPVSNSTPCQFIPEPQASTEDPCIVDSAIPNAYYMPTNIRDVLNYLEATSTDLAAAYDWWNPQDIWIKRQFTPAYPNNTNDVLYSGLNTDHTFYSAEPLIGEQGVPLLLNDGFSADVGKYLLDVSWCATSAGWDADKATIAFNPEGVGIFDSATYANIGFVSNSKSKMGYETLTPLGEYLHASMPLATVSLSGATHLQFGSYLENELGISKTISPYGLFNWFQERTNPINDTISTVKRAGWENSDWNGQFLECFHINTVFGQVPRSAFSINKYWSFFANHVPPYPSIVSINISNTNCAVPPLDIVVPDSAMILGTSDGTNTFFAVPPIYDYFPKWSRCITDVIIDNFELPVDSYYISINTVTNQAQLVLNTQSNVFDFTLIANASINIVFLSDTLIDLGGNQIVTLEDNFRNTREVNWITLLQDTDKAYKISPRLPDDILKFTTNSQPYNIVEYAGDKAFQFVNKFALDNPNGFSGVTTTTSPQVGIDGNNGSVDAIQLIDVAANYYTISCDVIFDSNIISQDYEKKFELILKADNKYIKGNDWGITDFYYVGLGTGKFDVGLSKRSVDRQTGILSETFLASYGEFNERNVKVNTWYTLKADVSKDSIKVYFYERDAKPALVLNYNINKQYEKITDRYLAGEFETLQAMINGLQNLLITYPNKLGNTTSPAYTFENFKQEFAQTLSINGYYAGFRVFNPLTYVTNVVYTSKIPKQYTWGSTLDVTSFNQIIEDVKKEFGLPSDADVKKIKKTLNYTTYVQINDILYYKSKNDFVQKYPNPVHDFDVVENKVFVTEKVYPTDAGLGLNEWTIGNHTLVWSLSSNVHNIQTTYDFFATVPNLTTVSLNRNGVVYNANAVGTSGTSGVCTSGTSGVMETGISGSDITIQVEDVITLTTACRTVLWPLDGIVARYNIILRVYEEGFTKEYTVLIKDKTFYTDELKSYMDFSQKKLRIVHINDNMLHLVFEDL